MPNLLLVIGATVLILAICLVALYLLNQRHNLLRVQLARYSGIQDLEAAQESIRAASEQAKRDAQLFKDQDAARRKQLDSEYKSALEQFDTLKREASLFEENLDDVSFGLYKPHFSFDTSEEYKTKLSELRSNVSALIKSNKAATFITHMTLNGNARDGARMVK
jgi:hypothetical protein